MNKPFILVIVFALAFTFSNEVKAQVTDPRTGAVGTTTTSGNGHWVSAQVAISNGSMDAAFLAADRACQEGTAIACAFAGELIIQGQAALATPEQSAGLFKRGCELGNANACQGVGLMLVQGIGIAEDVQTGKAFMDRACNAQNAIACTNLGLMFKMGLFGPANKVQSEAYLRQALHMQPDNKLAQNALAELQAEPSRTAISQPISQLRGRGETNKNEEQLTDVAIRSAGPSPTLCQRSALSTLMDEGRQDPKKPTWNIAPNSSFDATRITRQIELLLAFSDTSAARASASIEPSALSDFPTLADCETAYAGRIKAFGETAWLIAAVEPQEKIIYAITGGGDASSPTEANARLITLIADRRPASESKKGLSNGLWDSKTLSSYRVICQVGEVTPLFALGFDQKSKLVASSGFSPPLATSSLEPATRHFEIVRTLACASPQQGVTAASTHPLQAALSLQFEQDKQQTP
jgi:hypothetical protein